MTVALKAQQRLRAESDSQAASKVSEHLRVGSEVPTRGSQSFVKRNFSIKRHGFEQFSEPFKRPCSLTGASNCDFQWSKYVKIPYSKHLETPRAEVDCLGPCERKLSGSGMDLDGKVKPVMPTLLMV